MLKYYIFTVFLFFLCVLILLIIKALFKKDNIQEDKSEKLLRLYTQIDDMLESFELYVSEVRQEISDEKESIKLYINDFEKKVDEKLKEVVKENQKIKNNINPKNHKVTKSKNLSKQEKIIKLHENGMDIDDIAKEVNLNSSEVELFISMTN